MTKKTEIVYNSYKSKNFRAHILSYFLVVKPYRDKNKNESEVKLLHHQPVRNAFYHKTILYTSGISMLSILFKIKIIIEIFFFIFEENLDALNKK